MRRSVKVGYLFLVSLFVLTSFSSTAEADIVLESYNDQRPLDAEQVLGPLKAALEHHQVTTKLELILGTDASYLPLPGNPDRDITRTKIVDRIDRGINRAAHEAYEEAVVILEAVFRDLDNNSALAASDPDSRTWITKGRVALAFAYVRSKKPKLAGEVIVEHIRSYPDLSLKGEQEEVEKLYDANMRLVGSAPRGKLMFRVNLADAEIFVNDVKRGHGAIEVSLIPGEYRIVVRATGVYRRYKATIRPNETVERSVDWGADAAFTVTPDWIGFVSPRGSQRSVTTFIQQLAQRNSVDAVIVIGIVRHDGRRYLTARRYVATPAPSRPGRAIEIDKISDAKIEALATYITAPDAHAATVPSGGLIAIPDDDELTGLAATAGVAVGPPRWPIFAAVGVLGTSVPLGAFLLKRHNDCFSNCSRLTVRAGWGLIGLGGVAVGFGIVWIVHSDSAPASSRLMLDVQPVPGGGVAYINGVF